MTTATLSFSEVIGKAADELARRGKCEDMFYYPSDDPTGCSVCLAGAVAAVLTPAGENFSGLFSDKYYEVLAELERAMGLRNHGELFAWSDTNDQEAVVAKLREIAASAA